MPIVYGDQNFLIKAHDGPANYQTHLRELTTSGRASIICSPWHWVEMAEDADIVRSTSVADFVVSTSVVG